MYGTIAKIKVKPGAWEAIRNMASDESNLGIQGYVGQYVYRMDANPNEAYLVVLFESKETYFANAESPAQNDRFIEMMKFMDGEPEWHDGEVVFADHA